MAHNSELKCDVLGFTYDFGTRSATFYVAYDNCTDMKGAIALCERVDPKCSEILVYGAGDAAGDVIYSKTKKGWEAHIFDRVKLVAAVQNDLAKRLSALGVDVGLDDNGLHIGGSSKH